MTWHTVVPLLPLPVSASASAYPSNFRVDQDNLSLPMAHYRLGFDSNHLISTQLEVHTAQERATFPMWMELGASICSHPNPKLQLSTLVPTLWQACHPTFVELAGTAVPIAAKKNSIRFPTYCHDICQASHRPMIQTMWRPCQFSTHQTGTAKTRSSEGMP